MASSKEVQIRVDATVGEASANLAPRDELWRFWLRGPRVVCDTVVAWHVASLIPWLLALVERAQLAARTDIHLAMIAELSRSEPRSGEMEECAEQRATLLAEVGSLRAEVAELRRRLEAPAVR